MSGDRAYSVWRLSGDVQRSAIEDVGEEEAGTGTRQRLRGGPPAVHSLERARARATPLWVRFRSAHNSGLTPFSTS